MHNVDRQVDRVLTLLQDQIRGRGFTQLQIQEALGWGRSYISQLVTKQKALRVEQVLLILQVIGVEPDEFFAELFQLSGSYRGNPPGQMLRSPEQSEDTRRGVTAMRTLIDGLLKLLLDQGIINRQELADTVAAVRRE